MTERHVNMANVIKLKSLELKNEKTTLEKIGYVLKEGIIRFKKTSILVRGTGRKR